MPTVYVKKHGTDATELISLKALDIVKKYTASTFIKVADALLAARAVINNLIFIQITKRILIL